MNEQVAEAYLAWLKRERHRTIGDVTADTIKLLAQRKMKAIAETLERQVIARAYGCWCHLSHALKSGIYPCFCPCHTKESRMATAEERIKSCMNLLDDPRGRTMQGLIADLRRILTPSVRVALYAPTLNPISGTKGVTLQRHALIELADGEEVPEVVLLDGLPFVRFVPPDAKESPAFISKTFKKAEPY